MVISLAIVLVIVPLLSHVLGLCICLCLFRLVCTFLSQEMGDMRWENICPVQMKRAAELYDDLQNTVATLTSPKKRRSPRRPSQRSTCASPSPHAQA